MDYISSSGGRQTGKFKMSIEFIKDALLAGKGPVALLTGANDRIGAGRVLQALEDLGVEASITAMYSKEPRNPLRCKYLWGEIVGMEVVEQTEVFCGWSVALISYKHPDKLWKGLY